MRMKRTLATACALGAALVVVALPTQAATKRAQSTLCVGGAGCYSTIQAALDASHDGDTVKINPGIFAGGITITKSVNVVGAGALRTIIKGGGPVVTVGVPGAGTSTPPTVSIKGVTVTGGLTQSDLFGDGSVNTWIARGGGVDIPAASDGTPGATVSITDSAIVGNSASPTSTITFNDQPNVAFAVGAGIADSGRLTLVRTLVGNNHAGGPVASAAGGAGIWATNGGSLTLQDSLVSGNDSTVVAPNAVGADGGGMEVGDGETFSITGGAVSNNTVSVTSTVPAGRGGVGADAGGITLGDGTATIQNTRISGNTVAVNYPAGAAYAQNAGMYGGTGSLTMSNVVVSGNRVTATVGSATLAGGGPVGGALESDTNANLSHLLIIGNSTTLKTLAGPAETIGAFVSEVFTQGPTPPADVLRDSVVAGNTVSVSATGGAVSLLGAGVMNIAGTLELHNVQVFGNTGTAAGPSGTVRGGGIYSGPYVPGDPDAHLLLDGSSVVHNTLTGSPGLTVQGGGVFSAFPVVQTNSTIRWNAPDQCAGC